jgi:hypothetical protein
MTLVYSYGSCARVIAYGESKARIDAADYLGVARVPAGAVCEKAIERDCDSEVVHLTRATMSWV